VSMPKTGCLGCISWTDACQHGRRKAPRHGFTMKLDVAPQVVSAFPTGAPARSLLEMICCARPASQCTYCAAETAEEQNQCLAVVNAAINELNRNSKATQEMGKATECTYILAAGRCVKALRVHGRWRACGRQACLCIYVCRGPAMNAECGNVPVVAGLRKV